MKKTRIRIQRLRRFDRQERFVEVTEYAWCDSQTADPETGERPYIYLDHDQAQQSEEAARQAWLDKYGEPMPAA